MSNRKGGAPRKQIDYKVLDSLCAIQCTGEECAAVLEMDYDTLNAALKRDGNVGFSDYFAKKSANGKASLRRKQFSVANEGNPTMLIWLGKQWLGQSEKQELDLKSADGSMSPKSCIDTSKLSTETLKELMAAKPNDTE